MLDAKRLLEQFLGSSLGSTPSQEQRSSRSSGQYQPQSSGNILDTVQNYARNNPMLAGSLGGGLGAILLGSKRGRKLAKSALTYGGIAVVGGLAYKAYQDYQTRKNNAAQPAASYNNQQPTPILPPPQDSPFALQNAPQGEEAFALDLVVAMIAAAKADGHIDAAERATIEGRLAQDGLTPEEQSFLAQELAAPVDIERIVRAAQNQAEAVELYTASVLAITPDHPAERAYLQMLAARLELEPELAQAVERAVAEASG